MKKFETVIGLEVHLQLKTKTKVFCGCENRFGREPNTQTCPVCLGLPGTLPVLNKQALFNAIKIAMALNCQVNPHIKFDRKNYYYPDLPKGYQISQHPFPIAEHGSLLVETGGQTKKIRLRRAHLEEDAGKLMHDTSLNSSLVDYNRTGTPLVEMVTEPDIFSAQEAHDYLTTLKLILEYLEVSDCDMEKGSLRCDANISLRPSGAKELGVKTEVKNMNSFKAVKAALEFEEERQAKLLEAGERIIQETRLWNEEKGVTISMRSKEESHDYRYFPEPDLVPFTVEEKVLAEIKKTLPESPGAKFERLVREHSLSEYDAKLLVADKYLADLFENCLKLYPQPKKICNWLNGTLREELNTRKISARELSLSPKHLIDLITLVENGKISNLTGKDVLKSVVETGKPPEDIIKEQGLAQVSDESALVKIVDDVLSENPIVAEQVKQGKESAIGFLVGQSMKKSQGKANPKLLGELIKRRLQNVT